MSVQGLVSRHKPCLLIEPAHQWVVMDTQVAISRGLVGFSPESLSESVPSGRSRTFSGEVVNGIFVPRIGSKTSLFCMRRRLVQEENRQIAELSISHDGPYSVAVCMALDEEATDCGNVAHIVDDGSGEPVHEPNWGDRGWL